MDSAWVVVLAAGALLVRAGQMVGAMGLARAKNVASAGFRSLADLCVCTLVFWVIGSAILFQVNNGLFGFRLGYLIGWGGLDERWFAALSVILIATGIVAPVLAERSRLIVPLAIGALLAGVLVPMVFFWTKRGWLEYFGYVDRAGASAIHLVPSLCAAIAAVLVGPREGKYNRDGSSNMIPGHSVLMILISLMLMIAGWVPYMICASDGASTNVAANVLISAAAGGLMSLVIAWLRFGKADVLLMCSGLLGGLVAITAAADRTGTPGAFVIGAVAGVIVPWATVMLDLRLKIDDPAGVVAAHGVGAVWGLLAATVFATPTVGLFLKALLMAFIGIFVISITTITMAGGLMIALKIFMPIRAKEADEYDGLDLAEHDINAHPDFQQTMIKSYHLREA